MVPEVQQAQGSPAGQHPAVVLARQIVQAIRAGSLDEAEALVEQLRVMIPNPADFLVFPVMIAIQRNRVFDALRYLNSLDDAAALELKALCLQIIGDPTWEGHARQALESSPDPGVRSAMRHLLQLPAEDAAPPADGASAQGDAYGMFQIRG